MKNSTNWQKRKLAVAIALVSTGLQVPYLAHAQAQAPAQQAAPGIEEIVVMGRLRDGARALVMERIEQAYSAEVVGIEQMTRAGDSNIAMALRRVTGLTLIDGKYIYVRGLGERYSSATLNGAEIPSPELSRNVMPLDFIPTSILESIKISKAYSVDQPAAFGGGNVNIRTSGTPNEFVFDVSVGTGWNSESSDKGLRNLGDQGTIPEAISAALNKYQGDISPANITRIDFPTVGSPSQAQVQAGQRTNRDLLLTLNRDLAIDREKSIKPDQNISLSLGNAWDISNDFTFGAIANVAVGTDTVNSNQTERSFANPDEEFRDIRRTFTNESNTAALNLSLAYQENHKIATSSYVLQDDEDQSSIVRGFNTDFQQSSGRQRQTNVARLEQRELTINQVSGEHSFERMDMESLPIPGFLDPITSVDINWYYSDANAGTVIPNASSVQAVNILNPATDALVSSQLATGSTVQFNFLDLEDKVEAWGYQVDAAFDLGFTSGTLSGGYNQSTKTREYLGYTANMVSGARGRDGDVSGVLSDSNLQNLNNDFFVTMGSNFGTESYIAGETKMGAFGSIDAFMMDHWRVSAGVRWEDFKRGILPLNLLDYSGNSLRATIDRLNQPNQNLAFADDDFYPAAALTYINDGWLGTENFQVRLGYGKTVVRPDLREFADIQFIDPELNVRVQGNPNLVFSGIDHIDLRTEFMWPEGDSLTVSLFHKDIANPIETTERPGPQDGRLLSFDNAISGEIYGLEVEAMKNIGWGFFLSGNVVLSDSEMTLDAATGQTSLTRRLTGHSKEVVNLQLGYDSDNGQHSGSLLYNMFGERIFFGGRSPSPDALENPFHSLDLVYSYFPNDSITVRVRAQNLLDETREYYQDDIKILEVMPGMRLRLDLQWKF